MKYKNFYLFFVLFILILQFVYAGPKNADKPFMGPNPNEHKLGIGTERVLNFVKKLDLTDEQIAKVKEITVKSKKDVLNLRNEIKMLIGDIQDELKKTNANKSKVNSLINKISENQKKLIKIRIEEFFEVKEILTEEQFKELTKLIEEKKKAFKKKMFKKNKYDK